jgi:hypothetical protein
VWRHAATQGRVELGRWHRACDVEITPQCGEQKDEKLGKAFNESCACQKTGSRFFRSLRNSCACYLSFKKCEVDVFESVTHLIRPRQMHNNLQRAGGRRPVKPTERGRTRPRAEPRGGRWTAVASPTPFILDHAGRYHAGLGAASAQSA